MRKAPWLFFAGILGLIIVLRIEQLYWDVSFDGVMISGRYICDGLAPYRDFGTHYAPLIHYIYAAMVALAGSSYLGLNLIGIAWMWVTGIAFYGMSKQWFQSSSVAKVTTCLFVFSVNLQALVQDVFKSDLYTLLPIILALWALQRFLMAPSWAWSIVAGGALGVAISIKQPVGVLAIGLGVAVMGVAIKRKDSVMFRQGIGMAIGAIGVGLGVMGWLHIVDAWPEFLVGLQDARAFAAANSSFWRRLSSLPIFVIKTAPVYVMVVIGLYQRRLQWDAKKWCLIIGSLLSVCQVMLSGDMINYYFLQLYIFLALLAGYATRSSRLLMWVGGLAVLAWLVSVESLQSAVTNRPLAYKQQYLAQRDIRRVTTYIHDQLPAIKTVQFITATGHPFQDGILQSQLPLSSHYLLHINQVPLAVFLGRPDLFLVRHHAPIMHPILEDYQHMMSRDGFQLYQRLEPK